MDTTYLDFFMPKEDAYKAPKNTNHPLTYLEGGWKKRIVNLGDKSQESINETVYLRRDACEEYRNRARVAEIPPEE